MPLKRPSLPLLAKAIALRLRLGMMALLDMIWNGFGEGAPKALCHVSTRVAFMSFNATLKSGHMSILKHMGCSNTGTLLHQNDTIMSNAVAPHLPVSLWQNPAASCPNTKLRDDAATDASINMKMFSIAYQTS